MVLEEKDAGRSQDHRVELLGYIPMLRSPIRLGHRQNITLNLLPVFLTPTETNPTPDPHLVELPSALPSVILRE